MEKKEGGVDKKGVREGGGGENRGKGMGEQGGEENNKFGSSRYV